MTGRVVDSLEVSERFLWDLRQTVLELIAENHAGYLAELAHRHGMRPLDRALRRHPLRRHDLWLAGRRADGRVLVVRLQYVLQLHRGRLDRPHVRETHRAGRGVHVQSGRRLAGLPGHAEAAGRLGLLRRHQPLRLPPLRPPAVARPLARHDHGPLRHPLRADANLVGAIPGVAPISFPLPGPAATGAVRGRRLLPHAGGFAAGLPARVPARRRTSPRTGSDTTSTAARRKPCSPA